MRSFLPVGVKNYFEKPSQQFFKSRLNFHVKWFYENFAMILPLQAPGHTQTLNCKNVDTSKTWSKNDETKRFYGKCLCRYKISSHLSPFTKSFISRRTWIASIILPRTNGRYRVHVYMKSFRVSSFIANAFLHVNAFAIDNTWKHLRLSSQGIYGNIYRFSQIPTAVLKVYFTWFVRHLLLQTPWGNFFIPKLSLC